ncbi:hypothetical protein TrRE_jg11418 [Triparma retinervis]|uniref:Glutathione S-transferase n=1 Tax=Triparma retinervis TaxID=2557542 RepID=A0A9W7E1G1_9STRA|nr:hypothetical protein TrRE_jg11418 [Triparma retinervis]
MALTIYGHWVSQPARACLWLMRLNDKAFNFEKVEPLLGGTRTPEYKSLFPTGKAPGLVDGDFKLSEGTAIATYMCEKENWTKWLGGECLQSRALVNSYLSSHHTTSRNITMKVFHPAMMGVLNQETPFTEELRDKAGKVMERENKKFADTWLPGLGSRGYGGFVAGLHEPTIADLFAYCEFAQAKQMGIVGGKWDKRVEEWMDRVQRIEHHDDVHRSLFKLRDVYLANEEKRKQKWEMKVFEAMDFDEEGGLERDGVETLLKGKRILDAYDGIETSYVTL